MEEARRGTKKPSRISKTLEREQSKMATNATDEETACIPPSQATMLPTEGDIQGDIC